MKAKDYNKIINALIGDEFTILRECTDDDLTVELRHNRCGHSFVKSAFDIAYSGIRCNRCYSLDRENTILSLKEQQAIQLYDTCMKKLGPGYEIKGDTSSKENVIEVYRIGRDYFMITIDDFLNDRNLPEYLIHCTLKDPSIQFQILQEVSGNDFELLTDFNSLDDTIRIRDNTTESLFEEKVSDFMKRVRR